MLKLPKVLNCQAASEMSCRRRDGHLTRYERATLALHLLMCAGCRFMDRQFAILDLAARKLGYKTSIGSDPNSHTLSPEAREKLKQLIR
jgi:hypothetical protein